MDKGYVAGVGGANVDVHGQSFAPLIMRDSNPGRLHLSVGGVTRNILDNLTRLGQRCELVSVVGDDAFGGMLQASCRALGIGCSRLAVRPGHPSSSYISIMDSAGDMLVAMSDMSVLDSIDPAFIDGQLEFLNGARAVVCDGNLPAPALEHLVRVRDQEILLDTDYDCEQTSFSGQIGVRMRVGSLLWIGLTLLGGLLAWYKGYRQLASLAPEERKTKDKREERQAGAA